jgi:hypothetical protein
MNIKILAAFQTAAVIVSVTGISVMISLVAEYYPRALVWTGSILLAGSLIYLIYSVVLGRLETQEKYEEIIKKY